MRFASLLLLLIAASLHAQSTQPLETNETIPRPQLEELYRQELGDKFDPKQTEQLLQAHQLLEDYFEKPEQRKEIVKSLEATAIDPNILGRLTRIRMHWPDLRGGVYYINEKLGPHNVHYFMGVPKGYERTKSWPLVIKLPTADAFVGEPPADAEQVRQAYTHWMNEELTKHPGMLVIMPLLNLDELWGPSYAGMNNVFQPMLHAADRVNIDARRVYLWGHSMSAHAAWNLALHYPTYFASFCAMAGGAGAEWQRVRLMNLSNTLPVVWHDSQDTVIKFDSSRRVVRVLRQLKIDVQFEETNGVGHVPPESIIEKCWERMIGKVRELYPKKVAVQSNRPDTMFNRNDWIQIYQPLKPGEEQRVYFKRGSGFMVLYPGMWKLEATLEKGNKITAITQNVESMRFYVNDQMVDFSKPVTVNVNKKGRFEEKLKPSVDLMLKDQLFLGRGWRYFTAVVDVDFGGPPSVPPATTRSSSTKQN